MRCDAEMEGGDDGCYTVHCCIFDDHHDGDHQCEHGETWDDFQSSDGDEEQ